MVRMTEIIFRMGLKGMVGVYDECKVCVSMRVPDGWKEGEGMLKWGLCVMQELVEVRNENEKLERDMELMKNTHVTHFTYTSHHTHL